MAGQGNKNRSSSTANAANPSLIKKIDVFSNQTKSIDLYCKFSK